VLCFGMAAVGSSDRAVPPAYGHCVAGMHASLVAWLMHGAPDHVHARPPLPTSPHSVLGFTVLVWALRAWGTRQWGRRSLSGYRRSWLGCNAPPECMQSASTTPRSSPSLSRQPHAHPAVQPSCGAAGVKGAIPYRQVQGSPARSLPPGRSRPSRHHKPRPRRSLNTNPAEPAHDTRGQVLSTTADLFLALLPFLATLGLESGQTRPTPCTQSPRRPTARSQPS